MDSWKRKLRMGMVGGGQGAFIGGVHRIVAALDGQIELVAGSFSQDPENTRVTGKQLYLQEDIIDITLSCDEHFVFIPEI